ncbi:hypothetical protein HDV03_002500 [Kappamyces sp. JEL0829]|nr:hypothetical protein HDV03_002500 [Kappamyces sp. JEL0829]
MDLERTESPLLPSLDATATVWSLIANFDFKQAKRACIPLHSGLGSRSVFGASVSSWSQGTHSPSNVLGWLVDLEEKFHSLTWIGSLNQATLDRPFQACLDTISRQRESLVDREAQLEADVMIVLSSVRLGLLAIYPKLVTPSQATMDSLMELSIFVNSKIAAMGDTAAGTTPRPLNPVITVLANEMAFLWYVKLSHACIAMHDFQVGLCRITQGSILSFYSAKNIFSSWKAAIPNRQKSRLFALLGDLLKKLHVKIGLCFYKILHAKEIAMMHYSGQPKVRFHDELRSSYLLPILDLYDAFRPLNVSLFYLPTVIEAGSARSSTQQLPKAASQENNALGSQMRFMTESQLLLAQLSKSRSSFSLGSSESKLAQDDSQSVRPPNLCRFKQGFECEGGEALRLEGLKTFPVVLSYPDEETPIEFMPSMVSLLLNYSRYKPHRESLFTFQQVPADWEAVDGPTPYEFQIPPGHGLVFPDPMLDMCFVVSRLDARYVLLFATKGLSLSPLSKSRELALKNVLGPISRVIWPIISYK